MRHWVALQIKHTQDSGFGNMNKEIKEFIELIATDLTETWPDMFFDAAGEKLQKANVKFFNFILGKEDNEE